MRRTVRFSAILAVAPCLLAAQTATSVPPARGINGFDVSRLARIDTVLQNYVDRNEIAGAVALVLRNGRPVYEKAVGWADKESGRRMSSDAIFRIASQTKALTSTAVLMLVE